MTRLAYIARPIDLAELTASHVDWMRRVVQLLQASKWMTYNPASAFQIGPGAVPNPTISRINTHALAQADALVVLFPELPSIGVGMEIAQAQARGIPILVLTTGQTADRSWSLAGVTNCEIVRTDLDEQERAPSLGQSINWLDQNPSRVRPPEVMRVVLGDERAMIPDRAYSGDAGYDLYTNRDTVIQPHGFADVPCGVSVQLPPGCWGMITGRSSTLRKHNLLVTTGIIDNGYRGPLYAGVRNMSDEPFRVKTGMRLAQLIPIPLMAESIIPVRVPDLEQSDRGASGFGSSGE